MTLRAKGTLRGWRKEREGKGDMITFYLKLLFFKQMSLVKKRKKKKQTIKPLPPSIALSLVWAVFSLVL